MKTAELNRYEARAEIVKALAHPARLLIVDELAQGERCVCELRDRVGSDLSTVSKHLTLLKNAGIVSVERRGTQMIYRLCCPCLSNFFLCIEGILKKNVQRQAERI